MMSDEALAEMAEDIRQHGLRDDIVADDENRVLDGRNRLKACELAEVTPRITVFQGSDAEKLAFVRSKNQHRRHLTKAQRAKAAHELANIQHGHNQHSEKVDDNQLASTSVEPVSISDAADAAGVSRESVRQYRKVSTKAEPEVVEAVDSGAMSIKAGAAIAEAPREEQVEAAAKATTKTSAPKRTRKKKSAPPQRMTKKHQAENQKEFRTKFQNAVAILETSEPLSLDVLKERIDMPFKHFEMIVDELHYMELRELSDDEGDTLYQLEVNSSDVDLLTAVRTELMRCMEHCPNQFKFDVAKTRTSLQRMFRIVDKATTAHRSDERDQ